MTKLDPTFSSFTAIDSDALETVMGGDGLKNPKPPGKLKRGIGLLGLLGGIILGPHEPPSPEDLPRHIPTPPRPGTIVTGPLVPGPPPKSTPMSPLLLGLN